MTQDLHLAAFEPDFPHNLGAMIRACVCFGAALHIIEPCGFPLSSKGVRQYALDYSDRAKIIRHAQWAEFMENRPAGRLILLSTAGNTDPADFDFLPGDTLLVGRESAGVPEHVAAACDLSLRISLMPTARSLNVAVAAAIGLHAARRSLGGAV